MFYFNRPIVREIMYTDKTHYDQKAGSAREVIEWLKKDGFTHILYAYGPHSDKPESLPPMRIGRLLASSENPLAEYLEPLYTYTFTSDQGEINHYKLYRIL